jgi:hypothetical protein
MLTLLDRVETFQGDIMIITKIKYLVFGRRPRTSVMPMGFGDFGRRLGFQARYRTDDEAILREFHDYFVSRINQGHFEVLMLDARTGDIDLPSELEGLRKYFIGFHA